MEARSPGRLNFLQWCLLFVDPHFESWFTSSFWRLEFWVGCQIFGTPVHLWFTLYIYCRPTGAHLTEGGSLSRQLCFLYMSASSPFQISNICVIFVKFCRHIILLETVPLACFHFSKVENINMTDAQNLTYLTWYPEVMLG